MIVAEYTLDHPILRHTLDRVPGIELMWEDSHTGPDGQRRFVAWVESDDFAAVDAALRDDPSVGNPEVLADPAGRRLYRLDLAGEGREADLMPLLVEVGGVHQNLVATGEGWRNRTRFPDREAFERIHRFCRDHDIGFTFHRVWEPSGRYGADGPDLTDPQHEALLAAVETGYLEIPRRCSLAELGNRLGISESAASERFRRAASALIRQTVDR